MLGNHFCHEINGKKWIKMPKRMKKLVDLVCTNEILLYKSCQVSQKEKACHSSFCLQFVTILKLVKCGQMSFADVPLLAMAFPKTLCIT